MLRCFYGGSAVEIRSWLWLQRSRLHRPWSFLWSCMKTCFDHASAITYIYLFASLGAHHVKAWTKLWRRDILRRKFSSLVSQTSGDQCVFSAEPHKLRWPFQTHCLDYEVLQDVLHSSGKIYLNSYIKKQQLLVEPSKAVSFAAVRTVLNWQPHVTQQDSESAAMLAALWGWAKGDWQVHGVK